MKLPAALRAWGQDVLLKRVVRNSTYLFASQAIGAVLSIVTANLLGVASFGVLEVITRLVSNINRLLSFRMGEVVVKHMGEAVAQGDQQRAAAVVKAAGLAEGATSLLAYGALALITPWAARNLAHDPSLAPLFLIYGLSILGSITNETATGVLQVGNHFRSQAVINLVQSLLVAVLLGLAAVYRAGLWQVALIYLTGKIILGFSPIVLALYWLPRMLGRGWWKASLRLLPERRSLGIFAINTNLSGTINVLARDSEGLWISYFFSTVEVGYFKVAMALINLIVMPITPFISTTFPEMTRTIALKQWRKLRNLLRRVTLIAAGWTGMVAAGLLVLGKPVLFSNWVLFGRTFHIYSPAYAPAYPALLILLVGYSIASIFFWNRTLLLGFGNAAYPLKAGLVTAVVKTALTIWLVPLYGYLMEALLLTLYFTAWVGFTVRRGLAELSREEKLAPEGSAV